MHKDKCSLKLERVIAFMANGELGRLPSCFFMITRNKEKRFFKFLVKNLSPRVESGFHAPELCTTVFKHSFFLAKVPRIIIIFFTIFFFSPCNCWLRFYVFVENLGRKVSPPLMY